MKIRFIFLASLFVGHFCFSQHIEFKDSLFKKALLEIEPKIDLNKNSEIEFSEADSVKEISIEERGISDVSEIRYFKNLQVLNCRDNKIETIIIKDLPFLKELYCGGNRIKCFELYRLPSLKIFVAAKNELEKIEVVDCPNVSSIYLHTNQLVSLDVSKFTVLVSLDVSGNKLTSIDLSKNPQLKSLYIDGNSLKSLDIRKNSRIDLIYSDDDIECLMTDAQKADSPFAIAPPPQNVISPPKGK